VGIVLEFRACGQFHAIGASSDGADFAVEEPLLIPVLVQLSEKTDCQLSWSACSKAA
jgi:hypothetical protein